MRVLIIMLLLVGTVNAGGRWSEEGLRSVIKITLEEIDMYSQDFESLIVGTGAIESGMGRWLVGRVDNRLVLLEKEVSSIHRPTERYER